MSRGVVVYKRLFNEMPIKEAGKKKGRDKNLIDERNECLFCRFYFYSKLCRLRFEDVIEILSNEFFLSSGRVAMIIQNSSHSTFTNFENWQEKDFQKKYQFLNWKRDRDELFAVK
jgi:hypothetical protein